MRFLLFLTDLFLLTLFVAVVYIAYQAGKEKAEEVKKKK